MARSYTMAGVRGAAERAVHLARRFLLEQAPGSRIHDVQEDPRFQHRGVDLLWEKSPSEVLGVEVKGDRRGGKRRNYFFELVSNFEKNTPGCFLYSEADLLFYVFLSDLELHVLPLRQTRAWFLERSSQFELRHTHTQIGQERYTTVGALVPVREVRSGVAGVLVSTGAHPL
jgi:hypothetical protein